MIGGECLRDDVVTQEPTPTEDEESHAYAVSGSRVRSGPHQGRHPSPGRFPGPAGC